MSHQEAQWEVAPLVEPRRRLAAIGRLITFDKRGVGMSDPVPIESLPSIDAWIDDVRAVMDAALSDRAALVTTLGGGLMGLVFAATHPDRLRALDRRRRLGKGARSPRLSVRPSTRGTTGELEQTETGWGRGMMLDNFGPACGPYPACARRGRATSGSRRALALRRP